MIYWHDMSLEDDDMSRAVFETAEALVDEQEGLRERWTTDLSFFLDRSVQMVPDTSLGLIDYAATMLDDVTRRQRMSYNVCRMHVQALLSRVLLRQPYAQYGTEDATDEIQSIAKSYDRLVRVEFRRSKADLSGRISALFACVFGTAFTKSIPDYQRRRPRLRVYGPDRVLIDNAAASPDCLPRTLFHVDVVDASELLAMFPDTRKQARERELIIAAPVVSEVSGIRRMVEVIEADRIAAGQDKGRLVLALRNGVLIKTDHDRTRHRFAPERYELPVSGYYGESIVSQIIPVQREINYARDQQKANLRNFAHSYVERDPNAPIADADLMIGDAKVLPPGTRVVHPPFIGSDVIAYTEACKREASDVSGVNMLAVSAQKPAGLDSGKALTVYNDTQTQRFSDFENGHAEYRVTLAEIVIDVAKELHRAGAYSCKDESIRAALTRSEDDDFALSREPASMLSHEPAGREQQVAYAYQSGALDRSEYRALLGWTDLDKTLELSSAPRDLLEDIYERMLSGDITDESYEQPDHMMDKELAVRMGVEYWNRAKRRGTEQDRLDLVARFVRETTELLQPPEPEPSIPQGPIDEALPANPAAAAQLAQASAALQPVPEA